MLFTLIASAKEHIEHIEHIDNGHQVADIIANQAPEALHHATHSMSMMDYIFHSNIINWFIVVLFVLWLMKKFDALGFIEKKQKEIKDSIENAIKAKQNAKKELDETKDKIKNVEEETSSIIKEAKETAAVMSDKVKDNATLKVKELNENAQKIIDAQVKSSVNNLSKEVANAAFEIASEHIKSAIDDEIQNEFIDDFIENLDSIKVK